MIGGGSMLVNDFLENSARLYPDKTALVFGNQRLTYAEIDAEANRLANYLLAQGVQLGDRVGIYMDSCVELVVSIFGILKAGAVYSVINGGTKAERLAFTLNNCRAAGLIAHHRKVGVLAETLPNVPSLRFILLAGAQSSDGLGFGYTPFDEALSRSSAIQPPRSRIDVDLATIIYTSGSTGLPKGVMSTHLMAVTLTDSIGRYLENTPNDIILNVLPLSHCYGLYQLLVTFRTGATLVLEDGFAFPHRVLQLLQRERVTGFAGVPTIFAKILEIEELASMEFPELRYLTNAAAALPVRHIEKLYQLLPGVRIYSMYGQTECTRVCYLPPEELDRRPGSVGIAIPNTEVYVVDEAGNRVPPGVVGELVVRGSHLMRGYWESPEETARALRPGPLPGERVLYTGDLFRMDEEGFLYFVARKDDMIKSRGEKVSPREVENVLYSLDGIVEAAVIGVPDERLGEAIWAVVAVRDGAGLTERDVLGHCARNLEDFMVPKHVEFWPSLPKTSSGKTSKTQLREMVLCAVSPAH